MSAPKPSSVNPTGAPPTAGSTSKPPTSIKSPASDPPPKAASKPKNATPTEAEIAKADDAKLKAARHNYWHAKLQQIFGRVRRHIAFFIVCGVFTFANIWIFANAWQQEKAGENENWFHEGLFFTLTILGLVVFYFRLYRKSEVYQGSLAKRIAAERAAQAAKLQLEEEQKRQAFMGLIKDFQAAQTYEQKSTTMAKLLTVGLESTLLRQQAVDLLGGLNNWMQQHKPYLTTQNLLIWRLKSSLFEQSERFPVDSSTQDLSIKAINITEAIIKKHLADITEGRTSEMLRLDGLCLPTLTLTAQTLPAGSLSFVKSNLWQSSFAEGHIHNISFAEADLHKSSFWRAELDQVNFLQTNLSQAKLRTNLEGVLNLTPDQFFSTKEWELCYLDPETEASFFADPAQLPAGVKDTWEGAESRRRKLYFKRIHQTTEIKEI